MAMNLLKLLIKAIDKRRRGFLWNGKDEQANCGNCPIFCEGVQQPICYDALAVHNLENDNS